MRMPFLIGNVSAEKRTSMKAAVLLSKRIGTKQNRRQEECCASVKPQSLDRTSSELPSFFRSPVKEYCACTVSAKFVLMRVRPPSTGNTQLADPPPVETHDSLPHLGLLLLSRTSSTTAMKNILFRHAQLFHHIPLQFEAYGRQSDFEKLRPVFSGDE